MTAMNVSEGFSERRSQSELPVTFVCELFPSVGLFPPPQNLPLAELCIGPVGFTGPSPADVYWKH